MRAIRSLMTQRGIPVKLGLVVRTPGFGQKVVIEAKHVFAAVNDIEISFGNRAQKMFRVARSGQQPIVQFDDDEGKPIDPGAVGTKQVLLAAFDVDLGDQDLGSARKPN